jgi:hypothetical protein
MPPIEEYLKLADKLAQEVVNAWAINEQSRNIRDPEFDALFDKTCLYRTAREIADNHRKHRVLSEDDEAAEKATRQAFAEYHKAFYEKHVEKSNQARA